MDQCDTSINLNTLSDHTIDVLIENKEEMLEQWLNDQSIIFLKNKLRISSKSFLYNTVSDVFEYLVGILKQRNKIGECPVLNKLVDLFYKKGLRVENIFLFCAKFKNAILTTLMEKNIPMDQIKIMIDIFDTSLTNTLKLFTEKEQEKEELLQIQKDIIEDHVLLTTTDKHGRIIHTTDAFCKLSGYTKEELLGSSHRIMKDPNVPKEYFENMWNTIIEGKSWESKVRNIAKDGTLFIVKTKIIPIKDRNGEIVQYMAIRDDITAKEKAKYDPLTNAFTRGEFDDKFEKYFEEAKHNKTKLSLILVDADHFKSINDNYGHKKGDEVLIEISRILSDSIRGEDICARWGGEEFVVLLPGTSKEVAAKIAQRMRKSIKNNIVVGGKAQTCSFGVTSIYDEDSMDAMFERSDKALYSAKNGGRDKVEVL